MEIYIREDNVDEVKAEVENIAKLALEAWALQVQEYTAAGAPVDTGRLKNSITHETHDKYALVGTNVEYAIYQELGTVKMQPGKHFLKNACMNHLQEYKMILESFFNR